LDALQNVWVWDRLDFLRWCTWTVGTSFVAATNTLLRRFRSGVSFAFLTVGMRNGREDLAAFTARVLDWD
jgi:hypothetical protein